MGKIQSGKLLYHLTKLSNLDSIIERGLVSRSFLEHNRTPFSDVADPEIMDKRKEFGLDAYIPFHFHPYSSFDVAVKNRYEEEFIYICITRSFARSNHFLILPIHPLSAEQVQLLDYDAGITAIDWAAMESSSTLSDRNKNVRMAECLTDKAIPVSCFHSIAVRNESIRNLVQQKLPVFHDKKRGFWHNRGSGPTEVGLGCKDKLPILSTYVQAQIVLTCPVPLTYDFVASRAALKSSR